MPIIGSKMKKHLKKDLQHHLVGKIRVSVKVTNDINLVIKNFSKLN